MKKVLIISYYFPPLGMGGAQRPLKFAKYLPQFGWQPTVLTVKPIAYWAQDTSLLEEIATVPVIRAGSLDPQRILQLMKELRLQRWQRSQQNPDLAKNQNPNLAKDDGSLRAKWLGYINNKLLPFFLVPDSKVLWLPLAKRAAHRLLAGGAYDAILTTSPPHSVHLLGRDLAQKYRLPWVADFRDAWSDSVVVHQPTSWHRRMQKKLQKKVLLAADAVVCVIQGILEDFLQQQVDAKKFHLISNGFDPADYPLTQKPANEYRFIFCHSGSITRFSNPTPLLAALRRLQAQQPELMKRIKFDFVGYDALGNFREKVNYFGLDQIIEYHGYQTHRRALEILMQADALILIACHDRDAHFIPGKTFEYLGSKKPILAVSNVSDTRELLEKFPWVKLCKPEDEIGMVNALVEMVTAPQSRKISDELLRPYDRLYQAQHLAMVLDGLLLKKDS